jgi:hypothetical protein
VGHRDRRRPVRQGRRCLEPTVTRRAAWTAFTCGLGLLGGDITLAVYARIGWHPTDPVALSAAFILGAFAGTIVAAICVDRSEHVDRIIGRHRDPEALDLDDVLRLSRDDLMGVADAVREPRAGER